MSTPRIYCGHPADQVDHIVPRSCINTGKVVASILDSIP